MRDDGAGVETAPTTPQREAALAFNDVRDEGAFRRRRIRFIAGNRFGFAMLLCVIAFTQGAQLSARAEEAAARIGVDPRRLLLVWLLFEGFASIAFWSSRTEFRASTIIGGSVALHFATMSVCIIVERVFDAAGLFETAVPALVARVALGPSPLVCREAVPLAIASTVAYGIHVVVGAALVDGGAAALDALAAWLALELFVWAVLAAALARERAERVYVRTSIQAARARHEVGTAAEKADILLAATLPGPAYEAVLAQLAARHEPEGEDAPPSGEPLVLRHEFVVVLHCRLHRLDLQFALGRAYALAAAERLAELLAEAQSVLERHGLTLVQISATAFIATTTSVCGAPRTHALDVRHALDAALEIVRAHYASFVAPGGATGAEQERLSAARWSSASDRSARLPLPSAPDALDRERTAVDVRASAATHLSIGVHCGHVVEGFASKLATSGASFGVWGDAVTAAAALSAHMPAVARELGRGLPSSGVLLTDAVAKLVSDADRKQRYALRPFAKTVDSRASANLSLESMRTRAGVSALQRLRAELAEVLAVSDALYYVEAAGSVDQNALLLPGAGGGGGGGGSGGGGGGDLSVPMVPSLRNSSSGPSSAMRVSRPFRFSASEGRNGREDGRASARASGCAALRASLNLQESGSCSAEQLVPLGVLRSVGARVSRLSKDPATRWLTRNSGAASAAIVAQSQRLQRARALLRHEWVSPSKSDGFQWRNGRRATVERMSTVDAGIDSAGVDSRVATHDEVWLSQMLGARGYRAVKPAPSPLMVGGRRVLGARVVPVAGVRTRGSITRSSKSSLSPVREPLQRPSLETRRSWQAATRGRARTPRGSAGSEEGERGMAASMGSNTRWPIPQASPCEQIAPTTWRVSLASRPSLVSRDSLPSSPFGPRVSSSRCPAGTGRPSGSSRLSCAMSDGGSETARSGAGALSLSPFTRHAALQGAGRTERQLERWILGHVRVRALLWLPGWLGRGTRWEAVARGWRGGVVGAAAPAAAYPGARTVIPVDPYYAHARLRGAMEAHVLWSAVGADAPAVQLAAALTLLSVIALLGCVDPCASALCADGAGARARRAQYLIAPIVCGLSGLLAIVVALLHALDRLAPSRTRLALFEFYTAALERYGGSALLETPTAPEPPPRARPRANSAARAATSTGAQPPSGGVRPSDSDASVQGARTPRAVGRVLNETVSKWGFVSHLRTPAEQSPGAQLALASRYSLAHDATVLNLAVDVKLNLTAARTLHGALALGSSLALARTLGLLFVLDFEQPSAVRLARTAGLAWAAGLGWLLMKLPVVSLSRQATGCALAVVLGTASALAVVLARGDAAVPAGAVAVLGELAGWASLAALVSLHSKHVTVCEAVAFTRRAVELDVARVEFADAMHNELVLQRSLLPPSFPLTYAALEATDMLAYDTGLVAVRLSGEASLYKVLSAADVLAVYTELYAMLDALLDSTPRCEKASTFGLSSEYLLLVHPRRAERAPPAPAAMSAKPTYPSPDMRARRGGGEASSRASSSAVDPRAAAATAAAADSSGCGGRTSCGAGSFKASAHGGAGVTSSGGTDSETPGNSFCAGRGSDTASFRKLRRGRSVSRGGGENQSGYGNHGGNGGNGGDGGGSDESASHVRALNDALETALELVGRFERALEEFNARHRVGLQVTVTVLYGTIVRGVLTAGSRLVYCSWGRPFVTLAHAEAATRDLGVSVLLTRAQTALLSRALKRKLYFAHTVALPDDERFAAERSAAPLPMSNPTGTRTEANGPRAARSSRQTLAACAGLIGLNALSRSISNVSAETPSALPEHGGGSSDTLAVGGADEGETPGLLRKSWSSNGAARRAGTTPAPSAAGVGAGAGADSLDLRCGLAPGAATADAPSARPSARPAAAAAGRVVGEQLFAFGVVGLGLFSIAKAAGAAPSTLHLQYIVGRALGRGAFSRVRFATSRATGERVAIKTLRKSTLQAEHVQAELKILASLRGRQIVQLLQAVADPDNIHLVLEFVDGVPLSQLCNRPRFVRLSEAIVRKIGAQFVLALAKIHSLGVLHRDIKPENAILVGEHTIKIVDFGLSIIFEREDAAGADAPDASATAAMAAAAVGEATPPRADAAATAAAAIAAKSDDGAHKRPQPSATRLPVHARIGSARRDPAHADDDLLQPPMLRARGKSESAFGALTTLQMVMKPVCQRGAASSAGPGRLLAGAGSDGPPLRIALVGETALGLGDALAQEAIAASRWGTLGQLYIALTGGGVIDEATAVEPRKLLAPLDADAFIVSIECLLPDQFQFEPPAEQSGRTTGYALAPGEPPRGSPRWLAQATDAPIIVAVERAQLSQELCAAAVAALDDGAGGSGASAPEPFTGTVVFDALAWLLDAKVVHDFVLLPLADEPAERSEVVQMVLAVRDRLDHFKRSRAAAAERRRPMPPRTLVVDDADDAVEPPPPKLRPASLGVKAMEQLRAPAGPSAAAGPSPGAAGAVSSPRVPNPAGARRQRDDDSAASVAAASDLSHDSRVGQVHASRLLDQTNRRVGTPPYLAPEVVKDALYSRASEYWALGCVIYELVTTERLFDGPTVESVLERIATRPDRSRKIMELTHASMELKLFIAQLVSVEIPERLGVDPDDPPREHVFFSMAPEADAFSWEEFE